MSDVLKELGEMLEQRKQASPRQLPTSPACTHKGLNKILEKSVKSHRMIIAAKDAEQSGDHADVIYETADLWFHSLVALSSWIFPRCGDKRTRKTL